MSGERKILIASYLFPPSKKIGARRWGKFAKYLARKGWKVFVVCGNRGKGSGLWYGGDEENIHVTEVQRNYPDVLDSVPHGLFDKLQYRMALRKLQKTCTGNIYDRAILWEEPFLEACRKVIKENGIETMVATGAPFRLCHYSTKLKKEFGLKLICDFRDPWTWGTQWGYGDLEEEDAAIEKELENEVVHHSDVITVPVEGMFEYLRRQYLDCDAKFHLLPHAADPDDVPLVKAQLPDTSPAKFILYGSLYPGVKDEMAGFGEFLAAMNGKAQLDIYTSQKNYESIWKDSGAEEFVTYHSPVPATELFARINQSHFVVLLTPEFTKNHLSTKYYEVIHSRTPILVLGKEGDVSDYVTRNLLGVYYSNENLVNGLKDTVESYTEMAYDFAFDVQSKEYPAVTDDLINDILES